MLIAFKGDGGTAAADVGTWVVYLRLKQFFAARSGCSGSISGRMQRCEHECLCRIVGPGKIRLIFDALEIQTAGFVFQAVSLVRFLSFLVLMGTDFFNDEESVVANERGGETCRVLGGNFQVHEIGFRFMIDGTARHTCRGKKNFCSGLNFCNAVHCVVKAGERIFRLRPDCT
ncbi:hypothetical protein IMSAGC014_02011 [Bacteroidaceae bacterium]|nr:hypothetical protein IMSAGC014_02011 [Bacteroidaceae bacterium]